MTAVILSQFEPRRK